MRKIELHPIEFEDHTAPKLGFLGVDRYCLLRLAAALLSFIIGLFFAAGSMAQMLFMLAAFLCAAYDVVMKSVEEISSRHSLTMDPLVLLASLAAFVVRLEVDGAALMLLFRVCTLALDYAVKRSEENLEKAVDRRGTAVRVVTETGETQLDPEAVHPGDTVILSAGEVAAVDCLVLEGSAAVDLSAVTGSSFAGSAGEGDAVPAGARLLSGELRAEAVGPASVSLFSRIWALSRSDSNGKAAVEQWAELYRRFFAPVALALAAVVAVLLCVIGHCSVSSAIHRALCILIVVNPAGLLAALAVTAHTGIAGALSRGVLFKGIASVEKAGSAAAAVLDKNGTVTTGKYRVEAVHSGKLDSEILLKAAAHAAANADMPMARAVVDAYAGDVDYSVIGNFVEFPDGLSVEIDGIPVLLGSRAFLESHGIQLPDGDGSDEILLHLTLAGQFAGTLVLSEQPRSSVNETVDALHAMGCTDIVLLSEDSTEKTHSLSRLCGIEKYYSNCTAEAKLGRLKELQERSGKRAALYVGAGECDTDCLREADLGVILGGPDSPCAKDADVLLLSDDLRGLPEAIRSAALTRNVFLQGAGVVLGVKLLLILLAVFGISSQLWFDMLLDGCVGIAAVLNAVRAFPARK